jgi:hypothetical protein
MDLLEKILQRPTGSSVLHLRQLQALGLQLVVLHGHGVLDAHHAAVRQHEEAEDVLVLLVRLEPYPHEPADVLPSVIEVEVGALVPFLLASELVNESFISCWYVEVGKQIKSSVYSVHPSTVRDFPHFFSYFPCKPGSCLNHQKKTSHAKPVCVDDNEGPYVRFSFEILYNLLYSWKTHSRFLSYLTYRCKCVSCH